MPAFDGVIALGSDGDITISAVADGDSDARTLLFKYGGVIGSSCNDDWTAASSQLAYNPSLIPDADFTNWKTVPTQSEVAAEGTIVHTVASVKAGLGDPCRLVGYTPDEVRALLASNTVPDKGVWRTPSKNRYSHDNATVGDWDMSNQNSSGQPYGARLVNITNSSGVTHSALHPAAGCRKDTETGTLELQGTDGYYWSTTANSAGEPGSGYALMFNNQYSGRDNSYIKDTGRAVRCIP